MTSRSVISLALAFGAVVTLAPHAQAAKKKRYAPQANVASSEPCRGGNQVPCGAVYFNNYYLGTDPDPFIRSQIQRDLGAKFGGPD